MRITNQTLQKLAIDTVNQRVEIDHSLISAYLVGSLLSDEPLLGGATDIDIIFIHNNEPTFPRETIRITNEISLDIAHHSQTEYMQPRHLRLHPWLGPSIYGNPILLYDTQHFFDFTQASVGAQFNRPDNKLARSLNFLTEARQIWSTIPDSSRLTPLHLHSFLKSLKCAANAIVSLSGHPLTERRFLLSFPKVSTDFGNPGFSIGFLGLLGVANVTVEDIQNWISPWLNAYNAASALPDAPPKLHPCRKAYYELSFQALLESDQPQAIILPLLSTWTVAVLSLPDSSPERVYWLEVCQKLGLTGTQFADKLSALDSYIDNIEETLDAWAIEYGAK